MGQVRRQPSKTKRRTRVEELTGLDLKQECLTSPVTISRSDNRGGVVSVEVYNPSHAFADGIKGQLRGRFMIRNWAEATAEKIGSRVDHGTEMIPGPNRIGLLGPGLGECWAGYAPPSPYVCCSAKATLGWTELRGWHRRSRSGWTASRKVSSTEVLDCSAEGQPQSSGLTSARKGAVSRDTQLLGREAGSRRS